MIVQLTGSIIDLQPGVVVLDVGGVGYDDWNHDGKEVLDVGILEL